MKRLDIWRCGVVTIVAMLPILSEASVLNGLWGKTVTHNGVTLMRFEVGSKGDVCWGALKEDTMIQGFPCKGGWFYATWFRMDDNSLHLFNAYKPVVQDDLEIPAGTQIKLYRSGRIQRIALRRDSRIRGYLCKAKPRGDSSCWFRGNGTISRFTPAKRTEIDGILCEKAFSKKQPNDIHLHLKGRLKSGVLAEDTKINGQLLKKGMRVNLDHKGHLISVKKPTG